MLSDVVGRAGIAKYPGSDLRLPISVARAGFFGSTCAMRRDDVVSALSTDTLGSVCPTAQRLVEDCRSADDGREFQWALSLTTFRWMRFILFGVLKSVLLVMQHAHSDVDRITARTVCVGGRRASCRFCVLGKELARVYGAQVCRVGAEASASVDIPS